MASFSPADLQLLAQTPEVTLQRGPRKTTIWVVVVGDTAYIRSVRGEQGAWYQALRSGADARLVADSAAWPIRVAPVTDRAEIGRVSDAIRAKYAARWPAPTAAMLRPEVLSTTLRLEPLA